MHDLSKIACSTGFSVRKLPPRTWGSTVAAGTGVPTADEPRIEYRPRPDATPVAEARALAAVYAYILTRQVGSRGAPLPDPEGERAGEAFGQLPIQRGGS